MTNPPSPAASDSSNSVSTGPETPTFAGLPLETPAKDSAGGVKRTKNRRANTAERRATHNAVERARRETLNGRFLDLAGMLPSLSQIRKPSKSAIVCSSIAHLNASKRHRLLAAGQLRQLKDEADALRHEVNHWRLRAGIATVDEPRRAESFGVVLSGELEFEPGDMLDDECDEDEYGGQPDDEYQHLAQQRHCAPLMTISLDGHHPSPPQSESPQDYSPAIASPSVAAFEPAPTYDHHAQELLHHQMMLAYHHQQQAESDKWASYQQEQGQHQYAPAQGVW